MLKFFLKNKFFKYAQKNLEDEKFLLALAVIESPIQSFL